MKLKHHPLLARLLAGLTVGVFVVYGRLFLRTCRVRVVGGIPPELAKTPVVLALWHQQLVATTLLHKPSPFPLTGMMSASKDGQLMQRLGRHFGVSSAAGSSHRKAVSATRKLVKAGEGGGSCLFITPDGPRGPARVAKPGAVAIARMAGLPVLPCAAWYSHALTFGSWDSFRLPLPFSAVFLAYGTPQKTMTPEELTRTLQHLTERVQVAAGMDKPVKMA